MTTDLGHAVLDRIRCPADLKALTGHQLDQLCADIRHHLIDSVCRTGGHLGPNLGVVELSVAIHRVFDSPADTILWDTGHQTYVHKLLTGRQDFELLRSRGGLSGYASRDESVHDVIENSHASTVLSYADGISRARRLNGQPERHVVAVIGDGALTGGLALEALNNLCVAEDQRVVVIINDNGRSYDRTVGGLAGELRVHRAGREVSLFGRTLLGPVDGHDLAALEQALRTGRDKREPVLIHCLTEKGHGFDPAVQDLEHCLHTIAAGARFTGEPAGPTQPSSADPIVTVPVVTGPVVTDPVPADPGPADPGPADPGPASWTDHFSAALLTLAQGDSHIVGLSAAMVGPIGMRALANSFPERVVDVGIAEQHAVCSASGMAFAGLHPVLGLYATFLNRAWDQLIFDCALHHAGVTIALDRAGITGEDGPSHNGVWDLVIAGAVPGVRVAAPRDGVELAAQLGEACAVTDGPTILRYPKGVAPAPIPGRRVDGFDILRDGRLPADPEAPHVLLISIGALADRCLAAGRELAATGTACTVIDPRWVHPIDPELLEFAAAFRFLLTVEDGLSDGGIGSRISRQLQSRGAASRVRCLGVSAGFLPIGSRGELLAEQGLDAHGITNAARQLQRSAERDEASLSYR